ncbi:MAG: hypothetical protein ACI4JD_06725 [Ruminococcus sp.]
MDYLIGITYISGIALFLWKYAANKKSKPERFVYTADVDASFERVQQFRQQLYELDQLQNEIDISNMDNCYARTVAIKWGSGHEYVLELCEDSNINTHLEIIVQRERKRLTTSLCKELSKITHTGEVKTRGKTKSSAVGEEVYR